MAFWHAARVLVLTGLPPQYGKKQESRCALDWADGVDISPRTMYIDI